MKNKIPMIMLAIPFLVFASCASPPEQPQADDVSEAYELHPVPSPRPIPAHFPEAVRETIERLPEDAIVGIGISGFRNIGAARRGATLDARADISRQLNSVVSIMVTDFLAIPKADPGMTLLFQERVVQLISKSNLVGSRIALGRRDDDGNYWVVVELPQANAASEIALAARAANPSDTALQAAFDDAERVLRHHARPQ